jgi:hypothetical protein
MSEQAGEAVGLEVVEPGVHGVGITHAQQAVQRHSIRGLPGCDFEQGGTAFTHRRPLVVVAVIEQLSPLVVGQR